MGGFNRRDFMRMSAAGAIGAALSGSTAQAEASVHSPTPRGNISVWQTGGNRRHESLAPLHWGGVSRKAADEVTIDPGKSFQSVLGFGAAFTDAACYTLNRLTPDARKELFKELFHPSELGLSVSRICIGASDYSVKAFSYSEGLEPDPEMARFSIDHDRSYILPVLREARAVNPDMWILASPWSPPAWMKFNGSMLGGVMRRKWLGAYSSYFEKFLDAYAGEGVRVNSVTSQNEVDTDQDGKMPACAWPQEYEIEFIRDFLGPKMRTMRNPADIWLLDHNYNLWGRVLDTLEDSKVKPFIKGVAWHGYVGTPDAMSRVQQQYRELDQFWTEGGPDFETPGYETEWTKWSAQFTDILRNRARCIIAWNYALDEQGKPNIGPFHCAGVVTVDSASAAVTRSGQYWALAHFSRHIHRGAKILSSSSATTAGVQHVVAQNADKTYVAVLTNATKSPKDVVLRMGASSASATLPADSVTTLSWQ